MVIKNMVIKNVETSEEIYGFVKGLIALTAKTFFTF
jgi:hypothetical protein